VFAVFISFHVVFVIFVRKHFLGRNDSEHLSEVHVFTCSESFLPKKCFLVEVDRGSHLRTNQTAQKKEYIDVGYCRRISRSFQKIHKDLDG
jgi:hypothetical protein